jgi:hypothetical protein
LGYEWWVHAPRRIDPERWRLVTALVVTAVVVGGYVSLNRFDLSAGGLAAGGSNSLGSYLRAKTFAEDAGRDGREVDLGENTVLRPGDDGSLPVRPRWAVQLAAPEAIAVRGGTVYVADEYLDAFRLRDGHLRWHTGPDDDDQAGLTADGGVFIGLDGPRTVRAVAPWNYDISVDRTSGRLKRFTHDVGETAAGARALPSPAPDGFRMDDGCCTVMTARALDGQAIWSIRVKEPMFDGIPPITIDGGFVLMTTSGLLVAFDS